MKLLILQDQLYKSGGLERVLSNKINYWTYNNKNMEIHIVTNENGENPFYFEFPDTVIHTDIDINYDRSIRLLSLKNIQKAIKHFFRLNQVIKSIQPDIILLCGFGFDFYFLPLLKQGSRIIKENHSSRINDRKESLLTRTKSKVRNLFETRYDVMLFLSDEEASLVGHRNAFIIPNPIKHQDVIPHRTRNNIILAAGRITSIKGFDRLIDAWALIADQVPDWRIEIHGDGEKNYIEELKYKILKNNLNNSISLNPSTHDIQNKMLCSKIYAMTSLTECFPMVLLEAMQSFLPIISFDCPTGPRNIIKHDETGILVSNGDVTTFAEELLSLIRSEKKRIQLAKYAYEESKKYESTNIMQQWDSLFLKLMHS